ncbi:MAG: urease accessory protein UreF [Gammaproteobacteria bacterium]|nr:urease accessory protein UreF [Gammaproteobacteria bacterium]
MSSEVTKLANLIRLSSQALPVGGYAYSSCMESAIYNGIVKDHMTAFQWISDLFNYGLSALDLPALFLSSDAWNENEPNVINSLNEYLQANRETEEILLEDLEMGKSLARILQQLDVGSPLFREPSFVTEFAIAGAYWQIPVTELAIGFSFNWIENQVLVVTKSLPMGQSKGQWLLEKMIPQISECVDRSKRIAQKQQKFEWEFGRSLPGVAILSAQHEGIEGRLYRS